MVQHLLTKYQRRASLAHYLAGTQHSTTEAGRLEQKPGGQIDCPIMIRGYLGGDYANNRHC